METIRVVEKTGKDGALNLHIPLGKPEVEFDVIVILQPKAPASLQEHGWPAAYFDLAGSITDETFQRPPQGALPSPIELQ